MNRRKKIMFGKISVDFARKSKAQSCSNSEGFGIFGAEDISGENRTDIVALEDDVESNQMKELMGISGFGKKAKSFNVEEMMEQVKQTARELSALKAEAKAKEESEKPPQESSEEEDDEELIGPPVPSSLNAEEKSKTAASKKNSDADSDSDDSDEADDDSEMSTRLPTSHSITMTHGMKAVTAMSSDPSGARLATGSVDYDICFWDFAGMDSSMKSFRTLQPCENHPIKCLEYSITGDMILVISGSAQAKVIDRDGFEKLECVKGDMYITDMARTNGHIAGLCCGAWHPTNRDEFMTSGLDGTCRTWNYFDSRSQKGVIKTRSKSGLKTNPTSCTYNRDGNTIACGCFDGSIQLWDNRKSFVNAAAIVREAHEVGAEISCVRYSHLGSLLATRSCDGTLKLWDLRAFKKPVHQAGDLLSRYDTTDCSFSPDDSVLITGESLAKGATHSRLHLFHTASFEPLPTVSVGASHTIKSLWHPKLNQIFVGCGNGTIVCYYDPKRSLRGAKLSMSKTRKAAKHSGVVSAQQNVIITPHALPLFRQERRKTTRKQMEKDRLDPLKSKRPDLPITSGQGGRVASSGATLSSYVIRNLGLSKRVEDDQDPREAILKYAKEAEENPYWIAPAYAKTQPRVILDGVEGQPPAEKKAKTE